MLHSREKRTVGREAVEDDGGVLGGDVVHLAAARADERVGVHEPARIVEAQTPEEKVQNRAFLETCNDEAKSAGSEAEPPGRCKANRNWVG